MRGALARSWHERSGSSGCMWISGCAGRAALLRPLTDREASAGVGFEFPSPDTRAAELIPPPAPGLPTAGSVCRVLCPALIAKVSTAEGVMKNITCAAHFRATR